LLWALAVSLAAHSLLLTFVLGHRLSGTEPTGNKGVALHATLVERRDPIETPAATPTANASLVATSEQPSPPPTSRAPAQPAPAATADVYAGTVADIEIQAQPLSERGILGDLLGREQSEFPIEIDVPPKVESRIAALYPRTALAEGREGAVTVWVVVDEHGAPAEIQVVEGEEEFVDAVVSAINRASFRPARNNLVPIRFPISLEFHFALGASTSVAEARAIATR